jgi:hypothetical protein
MRQQTLKHIAAAGCLVAMLAVAVSASAVTITPSTVVQWTGVLPGNPNASDVAAAVGYSGTLALLYNQDQGDEPVDSGSYAGSYSTTFANTPTDPEDATITYGSGPSISGSPLYLLVKDGEAHTPVWYIFDLLNLDSNGDNVVDYSWNGTDTIMLDGFWPNQGAISHVSIFGPSNGVPDGGLTAMLLGFGVLGMTTLRRFLS